MLYDPKWEQKAKAKKDPLALATLISWLEQQPKDDVYCYFSHGRCLLGKYFYDLGFRRIWVGGMSFRHSGTGGVRLVMPESFADISAEEPWTFGAALDRAREYAT